MREFSRHLRETGESKGYNASFTRADRSRFLQALEEAVQAIWRSGWSVRRTAHVWLGRHLGWGGGCAWMRL